MIHRCEYGMLTCEEVQAGITRPICTKRTYFGDPYCDEHSKAIAPVVDLATRRSGR